MFLFTKYKYPKLKRLHIKGFAVTQRLPAGIAKEVELINQPLVENIKGLLLILRGRLFEEVVNKLFQVAFVVWVSLVAFKPAVIRVFRFNAINEPASNPRPEHGAW